MSRSLIIRRMFFLETFVTSVTVHTVPILRKFFWKPIHRYEMLYPAKFSWSIWWRFNPTGATANFFMKCDIHNSNIRYISNLEIRMSMEHAETKLEREHLKVWHTSYWDVSILFPGNKQRITRKIIFRM